MPPGTSGPPVLWTPPARPIVVADLTEHTPDTFSAAFGRSLPTASNETTITMAVLSNVGDLPDVVALRRSRSRLHRAGVERARARLAPPSLLPVTGLCGRTRSVAPEFTRQGKL
ncbi:hypothetical protein [Saccharopolyspora sp. NPDC050642]|uniref:hypothetical protein n=1 Tax=Saccharopolyspora sp. NPDC050642 TaxID=3157099 RepID=UPI0033E38DD3